MKHHREHLVNLEVVGYVDKLNERLVPTPVPPAFRVKGSDRMFMPPMRIRGWCVESHILGYRDDFDRAVRRGNATAIEPIQACPNHVLWVDEKLEPRYESLERYEQRWQEIYRAAQVATKLKRWERAEQLVDLAIGLSGATDPLLLKAQICDATGRPDDAQVLRDAAQSSE